MHHNLTKTMSLSNSKGSVSYIIQDLWYSFLGVRQSNTKLREMSFLPVCWHILEPRERPYPRLLQQMKPELEKKGNPWNGAIFCLPRRKNSNSLCQYARLRSLSSETVMEGFLWMQCQQGKQSSSTPTSGHWQNSEKCFKWVWIHNNPTEVLLQHHCARFYTSTKPWTAIKKLYWTVENTSTLQPSIWSPAGCDPWYEVWD